MQANELSSSERNRRLARIREYVEAMMKESREINAKSSPSNVAHASKEKVLMDDENDQKTLEQQMFKLTTTIKGMQKMTERLIALYDSDERRIQSEREHEEKRRIDLAAFEDRERELRDRNGELEKKMNLQVNSHAQEKLIWEQEREELLKKMRHYDSLLQNCPANGSSAQATPEPVKDVPKLQGAFEDHTNPHKCDNCNESFHDKTHLKYHQNKGCDKNPEYVCTVCEQQFAQRVDYVHHNARMHGSVLPKKRLCDRVITPVTMEELLAEKQKYEKYLMGYKKHGEHVERKNADEQMKQKPAVEKTVGPRIDAITERIRAKIIASRRDDKPRIGCSTILKSTAVFLKADAAISPCQPTTSNPLPTNPRQRFVSMLENHDCKESNCTVVTFRAYMKRAPYESIHGLKCRCCICKYVQGKTELRMICQDKPIDRSCVDVGDNEMQAMMTILRMGCPVNAQNSYLINSYTRETVLTMVASQALDYGLIGDNEKTAAKKKAASQDTTESTSSSDSSSDSSSSPSSSSSSSPSSDEEESSIEEELANEKESSDEKGSSSEWEIIESGRRFEVD